MIHSKKLLGTVLATHSDKATNHHPGQTITSFSLVNINGTTWICSGCNVTSASEVYAMLGGEQNVMPQPGQNVTHVITKHLKVIASHLKQLNPNLTNYKSKFQSVLATGLQDLSKDLHDLVGGLFNGLGDVGKVLDNVLHGILRLL